MNEPKRDWNKVIAEQEASGETIRTFCAQRRIGVQSFYLWRRRLRKCEPVEFAPVKVIANSPPLELLWVRLFFVWDESAICQ